MINEDITMQTIKIKLSILVGVSMLLSMPSVATANNNSVEESINSQSSSYRSQCRLRRCRPAA